MPRRRWNAPGPTPETEVPMRNEGSTLKTGVFYPTKTTGVYFRLKRNGSKTFYARRPDGSRSFEACDSFEAAKSRRAEFVGSQQGRGHRQHVTDAERPHRGLAGAPYDAQAALSRGAGSPRSTAHQARARSDEGQGDQPRRPQAVACPAQPLHGAAERRLRQPRHVGADLVGAGGPDARARRRGRRTSASARTRRGSRSCAHG
jgi:hypothetical protein